MDELDTKVKLTLFLYRHELPVTVQELARDSQPQVPTTVESLVREAQTCSTQARLDQFTENGALLSGAKEKIAQPEVSRSEETSSSTISSSKSSSTQTGMFLASLLMTLFLLLQQIAVWDDTYVSVEKSFQLIRCF